MIRLRRRSVGRPLDLFPRTLPIGDIPVSTDLGGGTWHQVFSNDFDYTVPIGGVVPASDGKSLNPACYAALNTDINDWCTFYADNTNSSWGEKTSALESDEPGYPGTYLSHAKWYPSKTVSFADSCFKVYLHAENLGTATDYGLGAAMLIRNNFTGADSYKRGPYLRYQFRMRHTGHTGLTDGQTSYWTSVPLAIDSANWPANGEFDWPEMDANKYYRGHYHPAATPNETWAVPDRPESAKDWHTCTVEWVPGRVRYWVDDQLAYDTTDRVPSGQMAVVMQHEQNWRAGIGSAVMEMDWLSIWAYTP